MVLRLRPLGSDPIVLPDQADTGSSVEPAGPAAAGGVAPDPFGAWADAVSAAEADACFLLDGTGVIRAISAHAAEQLGYVAEDVLGHWLLDVLHLVDFDEQDLPGDYADRLGPLLVLRSRGLMRGRLRIRRGDGRLVTFDCASSAVRDAAGAVVGSVSFLVDVARD
jgi:PAS domain S-box-containing protein